MHVILHEARTEGTNETRLKSLRTFLIEIGEQERLTR